MLGMDPLGTDTMDRCPPTHSHAHTHTHSHIHMHHLPQSPGLNIVTSFAGREQQGDSEGEESVLTARGGFRAGALVLHICPHTPLPARGPGARSSYGEPLGLEQQDRGLGDEELRCDPTAASYSHRSCKARTHPDLQADTPQTPQPSVTETWIFTWDHKADHPPLGPRLYLSPHLAPFSASCRHPHSWNLPLAP